MTTPINVLFLCTGNSARSIMAEALLNELGPPDFAAVSAGSNPKGQVHPRTVELLQAKGSDTSQLRSKSWDEFSGSTAPEVDIVVTVCDNAANEVCPIWPGHPVQVHWGFPDPAAFAGSPDEEFAYFDEIYGMIRERLASFVALELSNIPRTNWLETLSSL